MSLQTLHNDLSAAVQHAQQVASELTMVLGGLKEALRERGEWAPIALQVVADEPAAAGRKKHDRPSTELMQCVAALVALKATEKTGKLATLAEIKTELPHHPPKNQRYLADPEKAFDYLLRGTAPGYVFTPDDGARFRTLEKAERKLVEWRKSGKLPQRK